MRAQIKAWLQEVAAGKVKKLMFPRGPSEGEAEGGSDAKRQKTG